MGFNRPREGATAAAAAAGLGKPLKGLELEVAGAGISGDCSATAGGVGTVLLLLLAVGNSFIFGRLLLVMRDFGDILNRVAASVLSEGKLPHGVRAGWSSMRSLPTLDEGLDDPSVNNVRKQWISLWKNISLLVLFLIISSMSAEAQSFFFTINRRMKSITMLSKSFNLIYYV